MTSSGVEAGVTGQGSKATKEQSMIIRWHCNGQMKSEMLLASSSSMTSTDKHQHVRNKHLTQRHDQWERSSKTVRVVYLDSAPRWNIGQRYFRVSVLSCCPARQVSCSSFSRREAEAETLSCQASLLLNDQLACCRGSPSSEATKRLISMDGFIITF